jgi:hypothetical protein
MHTGIVCFETFMAVYIVKSYWAISFVIMGLLSFWKLVSIIRVLCGKCCVCLVVFTPQNMLLAVPAYTAEGIVCRYNVQRVGRTVLESLCQLS